MSVYIGGNRVQVNIGGKVYEIEYQSTANSTPVEASELENSITEDNSEIIIN